jgi:hypothetical protein
MKTSREFVSSDGALGGSIVHEVHRTLPRAVATANIPFRILAANPAIVFRAREIARRALRCGNQATIRNCAQSGRHALDIPNTHGDEFTFGNDG